MTLTAFFYELTLLMCIIILLHFVCIVFFIPGIYIKMQNRTSLMLFLIFCTNSFMRGKATLCLKFQAHCMSLSPHTNGQFRGNNTLYSLEPSYRSASLELIAHKDLG